LGIQDWPGLVFEEWGLDKMIPAAGQAAIAWETRFADVARFGVLCDPATYVAVSIERAFLARLGEGCHSAFAVHFRDETLYLFHALFGRRVYPFSSSAPLSPQVESIVATLPPSHSE
jgi:hydroxymethylbilane synthase